MKEQIMTKAEYFHNEEKKLNKLAKIMMFSCPIPLGIFSLFLVLLIIIAILVKDMGVKLYIIDIITYMANFKDVVMYFVYIWLVALILFIIYSILKEKKMEKLSKEIQIQCEEESVKEHKRGSSKSSRTITRRRVEKHS